MKFIPSFGVLLLALLAASCGRESPLLPAAAPPPRVQQASPEGGEAPGGADWSGDEVCHGEWVTQTAPDGTPILVCVGPHAGSGT